MVEYDQLEPTCSLNFNMEVAFLDNSLDSRSMLSTVDVFSENSVAACLYYMTKITIGCRVLNYW